MKGGMVESGGTSQLLQYCPTAKGGPSVWTLILFAYAIVEVLSAAFILWAEIWLIAVPNRFIIPLIVPAFWLAPVGFIGAAVNMVFHLVRRRRRGTWMVAATMVLTTVVPPVFVYLVVKYD